MVIDSESKPRDGDNRIFGAEKKSSIPPPTANIPRKPRQEYDFPQATLPPLAESVSPAAIQIGAPKRKPYTALQTTAEFAPNAFPAAAPQYAQSDQGAHWYDRLIDVLLGEDESLPRNRLALICIKCRLVNGQAPPGAKRSEDVGMWRCFGCGTMNGDETETTKIIATLEEELNTEAAQSRSGEGKVSITLAGEQMEELQTDFADQRNDSEETDLTQYSGGESDCAAHQNTVQLDQLVSHKPEAPKRKAGRPKGSKNKRKEY